MIARTALTSTKLSLSVPLVAAAVLATGLAATTPAAAQTKGATKKTEPAKPDPEPAKTEPASTDAAGAETGAATSAPTPTTEPPPAEVWDIKDVEELPGKTYLFVGLRYRGNIIPKFMLNMFVDEGKTIYSNSIGVQLDIRKDGFSLIPALTYTEYGTGDVLFKQKNTSNIPGNFSLVNSSMKAVYASADLLWSAPISKNVSFEYGAGFGIGVIFGDLVNNWVQVDPNGEIGPADTTGLRYSRCATVGPPGTGCNKADHQNSEVDKVGNYTEKSWFDGGSKPVVFPLLAIPQIGLRFKPIKQLVARTNVGFSLTGFYFGLSAEYGLEQKPKP